MGETTAQTIDDSFQEVVNKRSNRREDKLNAKEKKKEAKLTNQLNNFEAVLPQKVGKQAKPSNRTEEERSSAHDNTLTNEDDQSNSFEQTAGGTVLKNLSKKKKEYLEQDIVDRSGAFKFEDNPTMYKKARKRLQNRESAVRSRLKKRQELEVLEVQVRKLMEEKAAVESANDELKRQNKYWEELFARQQLQSVQPVPVATISSDASLSGRSTLGGIPSQAEFIRSDHSSNYQNGEGSLNDESFPSMRLLSDSRSNKRQRRSAGGSEIAGGFFDVDRSHELLEDLGDPTYEQHEFSLPKNDPSALQRQLSIECLEPRLNEIDYEDCYLERQPAQQRGSSLFLGLALVFGAVGAVTTSMSPSIDTSIDSQISHKINSGSSLAGAKDPAVADPVSMIHGIEDDVDFKVRQASPQQTPMQNILAASSQLWLACMALPQVTMICLVLSFVFFILYVNPLGLFFSQSSDIDRSERRRRRSSRKHAEDVSPSQHHPDSSKLGGLKTKSGASRSKKGSSSSAKRRSSK